MTEVTQTLHEMKDLYLKLMGEPAPELGAANFTPFPPGVDPVRFATQEVKDLQQIALRMKAAAAPIAWVPRADSYATPEGFVIRLEIPGVGREHLKVLVAGNECIVRGERPAPEKTGAWQPLSLEWAYGPFERRFALPFPLDPSALAVRYAEGVLELRITIDASATTPKELKIEVA